MNKYLIFLLLLIFFLDFKALVAQSEAKDSSTEKKIRLLALPIAFYSPETRLGFGAAGNMTFRFKGEKKESRPSQLQVGFAYTLEKQILSYLPFQLFVKDAKYRFYGEIGYYRYVYDFYGVSTIPGEREIFSVNFPRIRLNGLYRFKPNLYIGLRYWMDDYNVTKVDPEGLLSTGEIPGSSGSFISGVGPIFIFDSRDHLFEPQSGFNIELVNFYNGSFLGSDFEFRKWYLDAATYWSPVKNHVWAFNIYGELTFGEAPFNELALLGGNKRMRGYYEGYLRNNHLWVIQTEYRLPLFWRIGGVVFGGFGGVAANRADFSLADATYHVGTGLRVTLDEKEKLKLRIDVAFGKESQGFYFTVGEAF